MAIQEKSVHFQPFTVGYEGTRSAYNQTATSEYNLICAAQKVYIVAKAALIAVAETLMNAAKIVANLGISFANKIYGHFIPEKSSAQSKGADQNPGQRGVSGVIETTKSAFTSLKGSLSSLALKTMEKTKNAFNQTVTFVKDHKKAIGATVALAGLGAAGYYGYQAYTKPDGSTAAMKAQYLANTAKTPNVLYNTCVPKTTSAPLFEAFTSAAKKARAVSENHPFIEYPKIISLVDDKLDPTASSETSGLTWKAITIATAAIGSLFGLAQVFKSNSYNGSSTISCCRKPKREQAWIKSARERLQNTSSNVGPTQPLKKRPQASSQNQNGRIKQSFWSNSKQRAHLQGIVNGNTHS